MSKRSQQNGGNKKKKLKTYHNAKEKRGGSKSSFNVLPGMAGVIVMCARGKESRAIKEALDILARYGDELYPREEEGADSGADNDDDEELDLEASIAKEVAAIKNTKVKKRYANITTGTDCVAFIRCSYPVNPVKLVHHMLTDLNEKQTKTTRYISRYLPVEKACHADIADITVAAKSIFEPHFNQKDSEGNLISKKFAVACRVRNCTKLDRMEVINALAAAVGQGHKVDLQEPELTIIAEVCQNICMLSVVEDFNKLKKYNIESILGINVVANDPKKETVKVEVNEANEKTAEAEIEVDGSKPSD